MAETIFLSGFLGKIILFPHSIPATESKYFFYMSLWLSDTNLENTQSKKNTCLLLFWITHPTRCIIQKRIHTWWVGDRSVTIMSPELLTTATRLGYNNCPSRLPHSPNWNLNRPSLSKIWILKLNFSYYYFEWEKNHCQKSRNWIEFLFLFFY